MRMHSQNDFRRFFKYVRVAICQAGNRNEENHPSITLGNVDFWIDGGDLAYSHPVTAWDMVHISEEMTQALSSSIEYKRFAVLAGYQVVSWPGDARDDEKFYWKRKGVPSDQDESNGTFETEAMAWADCCIMNKIDFIYKNFCEEKGFTVEPSVGGTYYWQNAEGSDASEDFPTEADAWRDCFAVMTALDRDAEPELVDDEVCPAP